MGFRKPLDYNSISHQIQVAGYEINNMYNDGFTQFEIKKDLYKLKYTLDRVIKNSVTFVGEEEFLKEIEQKMIWETLKK